MKIKWEVEDGYCGKSRPQSTEVPDEDIRECKSEEEVIEVIDQYVRDDFDQKITYFSETEAAIALWREAQLPKNWS